MTDQLPAALISSFFSHALALFACWRAIFSCGTSGAAKSICAAMLGQSIFYMMIVLAELQSVGIFRHYTNAQVMWQAYLMFSGFLMFTAAVRIRVRGF